MSTDKKCDVSMVKRNAEQPFDVVFIAGHDQKKIYAHRAVMHASSKYFTALLGPNYKESKENVITISEIDGNTLKAIVDYCYTSRIELRVDNADDILDAAARMEFSAIEQMVEKFWLSQLSAENCMETLAIADQYSLTHLWQEALKCWAMNFDQIPMANMLNIDPENLQKFLAYDEIAVREEQIFNYIAKWIEQSGKKCTKSIPAILKLIRLKHITSAFLRENIEPFYKMYGSIQLVNDEYESRHIMWGDSITDLNISLYRSGDLYCANPPFQSVYDQWPPERVINLQKYNFHLNRWEHLHMISWHLITGSAEHLQHSCREVVCNGKLFSFSWYYSERLGKFAKVRVMSFDLTTFQQKTHKHIVEYREYFAPVAVGRYIYVFGGLGSGGHRDYLRSCERYDTELNTWEPRKHMPFRRTIHAAIEMHGKIYAVNEERMLCYDPDSDEWTLKASNEHRNGVSCMFKSGQFLYTIERTVAQRIYQYNPANNVWTMIEHNDPNSYKIRSAAEHRGITYTLRSNGVFGSLDPTIPDSIPTLSQFVDGRVSCDPCNNALLFKF